MRKRRLIGCPCGRQGTVAVAVCWLAPAIYKGLQPIAHPAYLNGFDAFLPAALAFFAVGCALKAFRQWSSVAALDEEGCDYGGRHE